MKDLSIMGNVEIRGMEYNQLRIEEEMDKKLIESLNIHATKLENVAKSRAELLSEGLRELVANVCASKYAETASAIQDVRTETRLNSEKQSFDLQNFQKELEKLRLTNIPELRASLTNMSLEDRADKAQIKENFEKAGRSLGILATRNKELQSQVNKLTQEMAQVKMETTLEIAQLRAQIESFQQMFLGLSENVRNLGIQTLGRIQGIETGVGQAIGKLVSDHESLKAQVQALQVLSKEKPQAPT